MRKSHNRVEYKEGQLIGECLYLRDLPTETDGGGQQRRTARFVCRCGEIFSAKLNHVKYGVTNSCGCYKMQRISEAKTVHGMRDSPEYDVWCHFKQRCNNKEDSQYHNYGGRGITVCQEWENSFTTFINDVGLRPSPKHSLDRIRNNEGYCKENCRWVIQKEQCRNRRGNFIIQYMGVSKTLVEWSEHLGVRYGLLLSRIKRFGWTVEKAFTTPIKREKRYLYKK